jgi:hypothetical protein
MEEDGGGWRRIRRIGRVSRMEENYRRIERNRPVVVVGGWGGCLVVVCAWVPMVVEL